MPFDFVAEVRCFFGAAARELECVAQDAVDAAPREDRFLDDELVVGALEHPAADRRVFALVVFAHDPEVDVAGLAVGQRRAIPGISRTGRRFTYCRNWRRIGISKPHSET